MLRPTLIATIALVWIGTGIVSLLGDRQAGYTLLSSAGIEGPFATFLINTGSAADLALGLLFLSGWKWPAVCLAQAGLMISYLAIASMILPTLWLDPLAALTKTLPLLIMTLMLALDEPPRQSRKPRAARGDGNELKGE